MKSKHDSQNLPKHIAIIMDGNRRWAQLNNLSVAEGHRAGSVNLEKIIYHCRKLGIEYLTVYALSTENFHHRSVGEIKGLFKLLIEAFQKKTKEYQKSGIKLFVIGNFQAFPLKVKKIIKKILKMAIIDKKMTFNIALNYGGRDEIITAIKKIIKDKIPANKINEKLIKKYLYTKDQPDPDLIIRPGGEKRLSNFLIWQMSYAELYFSDILWPDFDEKELDKAISWFQQRHRRLGK